MRIHALALVTALVFAPTYAVATDEPAPEGADTPQHEGEPSQEMPHDAASPSDTPAQPSGEAEAEPSDEAEAEPSDEAEAEPSGEAEAEPSDEAEARPSGEAEAEPKTPTDPGSASAGATGTVARSAFTTNVVEREPVDRVDVLSDDQAEIFFFTELLDLAGQTVVHRWEYDGKVMAEVPFEVKGPRWRVYSKKSLLPEWKGECASCAREAAG